MRFSFVSKLELLAALLCFSAPAMADEEYAFPLGPDHTPTKLNMSAKLARPPAYNVSQSKENLITPSPSGLRLTYESLNLPGG